MGILQKAVQQNLGGCQMEVRNEEGKRLGTNEGTVSVTGAGELNSMVNLTGESTAVEQQLQTQNGEQWSSLQVLECWSWSEKT